MTEELREFIVESTWETIDLDMVVNVCGDQEHIKALKDGTLSYKDKAMYSQIIERRNEQTRDKCVECEKKAHKDEIRCLKCTRDHKVALQYAKDKDEGRDVSNLEPAVLQYHKRAGQKWKNIIKTIRFHYQELSTKKTNRKFAGEESDSESEGEESGSDYEDDGSSSDSGSDSDDSESDGESGQEEDDDDDNKSNARKRSRDSDDDVSERPRKRRRQH